MSSFFQKLFRNDQESNSRKTHKNKAPQKRRLHIEPLESREMLSISPTLPEIPALLENDAIPVAFVTPLSQAASTDLIAPTANETDTLDGLTLNITAANYEELNAQYAFSSVTAIRNCNITLGVGISLNFSNCTELVNTSTVCIFRKFPKQNNLQIKKTAKSVLLSDNCDGHNNRTNTNRVNFPAIFYICCE